MKSSLRESSPNQRSLTLDFDGGVKLYRNAELGMDIPVNVSPSGISAARQKRLAAALRREGFDVAPGGRTIHVGKTSAFDAFGRFAGLAEGIGAGNAFVLLDDSASDAELLAVIRHEAGHILGMLDHGGAGLARYAVYDIEYDYDHGSTSPDIFRQYLKRKTTTTWTYSPGAIPSNDSIYVGTYENSTEIIYEYDRIERSYDPETHSYYFEPVPATEYIEDNNIATRYFPSLSGVSTEYSISNRGGSITGCTAQGTITITGNAYFDKTRTHGWDDGVYKLEGETSDYRFYQGTADGCKSTTLKVEGNAVATNCEAAFITICGDANSKAGWNGDGLTPIGDDYAVFKGVVKDSTVIGWFNWEGWGSHGKEIELYNNGRLDVGLGGKADNITVECASVNIGLRNDLAADSLEEKTWKLYGNAVVGNLVVDGGDVFVGYCGELHNADIKGTLRITQGAQLSGVINSTRVSLSNVVPSTAITIKLDLRDFAVANYVETEQNEHGNVTRKVEYFANYTTRITEYTYSYKVNEYNDLYARVESITVTNDTFDNADGRFDMSNWEYRFEADIGVVDSMSLPHIQVDFGGTEKEFNSGTLKFDYPSTTREIQFRMNSNTKKWKEQWVTVYEDEEEENVKEEYYRGYISYNAALYGETEDVLWLSNGEESDYSVTLDPIMRDAVPANDVIPGGGSINGATLTVKGENVNSGRVTIKAEDSEHRSLTCDLDLLVVPKELPVIGKSGTSAYTNLLKKAQKDRLSEIRAELPCDAKLDLGGMKFSLSNMSATLTVNWSAPSITMKLEGKLDWTFGKSDKTLTVDLSGDNYFSVTHSNKQTDWDIVGEISVPDFSIGRFAFSDMYLSVNKGQSSVSVGAYVQLPGIKYKFGGSIGVVDGYLDSMSIGVGNLNVPLGATGLMLQSISGSIDGIATSLDMTFGGNMGFTYGPKINIEWDCDWLGIDDGEYSLLEIDVGATISTSGEITGQASISSLGGFITGAGGVTAREGYFSVNGNFSLLGDCISIEGELHSGTGGVVLSGKGRMQVPKDEKFGLLAGVGLSVEVKADFGSRYVLAWENIVLFGNTYAIGCKTTFDGEVELLGSADIWKEVENTRGNLRSLKSISVKGISVAEPLRGETTPSASEKYTVSGDGVSLFQFNFSVSGTSVSLSYDGTEYTQAEIMAGNYDNMQIVNALTTRECITIAVNNANSGEWTMNAYGDGNTTFGAYTIAQAVEKPVVTSVTLGDDARSATINYTLGDLSALKNATVSIFRNDGGKADHGGLLLAEFTAADATGTFEYVMTDEVSGGDYAFYLMVTSDNLAPGYSDLSAAHKFLTIDTEAPDRIQRVNAEWKSSGTVLTWEAPYDNSGVTGYKVRYRTSEEDEWSEGNSKTASFVFDSVPNGTYAYQVAACDEAGNIAAWSEKNSVLVLTTANAAYKDITLTEDLVLKEYESAVNINAEDFALTSVPNTLVSGSTLGNAALSGIMEDSTVNGKVVLQADGLAGNTTVNGTFEIQGTAEGVTVADGGSLLICRNAVAKNITVNAGGSVIIYNSAAEVSGLVMDRGVNLTIAGVGKYQLTDDIRTAGTLTIQSFVVGNGRRIHFEQYKQADEITNPGTDYARDDIAFLSDFDDLGDGVLEIEIDSSTFASYKIADKFTYFKGAITVTDHASGVSAAVGFDDYTVVGNALCMLSKTGMGGYGASGLYLIAKQAAVAPPTITVTNADSDLQDTITVRVASPCAKRTYRYSLNEDMSDAVVVVCDNDTPLSLAKSDLTANATYYIQAKVESEYGIESPWSTTTSFTVVPKYNNPLPSVTAEKNGDDWIVLTVTGMETAEYEISICDFRYADNPEMENAVSSISYQEEAWFSRAQFVEGKDYYFQVRVQSRGEWSEWGPTLVFNTQGYDYDGITVGTDGQYTELWLDNKKARNITVTTGGSVYGSSAEVVDGITINGGYFLACSLVTNAVVNSGDFWLFTDSDVSDLVVNGGNLYLRYGRLNGAIIGVEALADLIFGYNPTITGTILIQGKMEVSSNHRGVTTDAQFVFDLGAHEAMKDTMFIDFTSPLVGTRTFTVKLDDTPEKGDYKLSYTPKSGEFSISLAANNGTDLGVLGLGGEAIQYNGLYYSLFSLDSVVYLHVSADDAPVLRGKIKLSRNGTVFAADNRYQNLTVSASDKCDHVLVEEGGQLEMVTVGDGGSIDVYGDVYGATVEQGGKLTMNLGCVLADRPVNIQKGGEIIVNGGSVSVGATVNVAGTMTVNGALQSCEESQTEAAHEFAFILDRFDAPNTDVLISDYELVKTCNASFSVSVSMNQAAGEYQLMGNAADFSGSVSISFAGYDNWRYDLTIGKERSINGTDFALAVRDNILTLTVGGGSPVPPDIIPDVVARTQTWDLPSDTYSYVVEYSTDDFEHVVRVVVNDTALDSFAAPAGCRWRVRAEGSDEWSEIASVGDAPSDDGPRFIKSNSDGVDDVFFARAGKVWEGGYQAQHLGSVESEWKGTGERVNLAGRNRLGDLFEGSYDANVLLLTDDANGDALFVDDIYTALPGSIEEQQARIAQINEIRAGAGNDVVDMTSQRFEYVGEGLTIRGGDGDDTIWAVGYGNYLFGDAGNDRLVGGAGLDFIAGGAGNDSMHGGGGRDVFTFGGNWGVDTVEQLADDESMVMLWFAEGDHANWNAATMTYTDGSNSVTVKGVTADEVEIYIGEEFPWDFEMMSELGIFAEATSENVFEDKNKGFLASL